NPDIESGEVNAFEGDIRLFFSRIYTLDGGDIQLIAPGGEVNAGLASPPTAFGIVKGPEDLGIVAQGVGDINSVSFGDFAVNESRVFAADGGNILVWSTRGDIDAGRGAKTAISAPPPQVTIDPTDGSLQIVFPAALTGSGIQTIATSEGTEPGDVDLFAPRGVVNAGDAGIVAGNLTVAAVAVLGADNIDVSGVSIGVPVDTAVAPGLANVSAVASGAQQAAQDVVEPTGGEDDSDTPLADAALGFLDVFIVSFGDCDPETGENCEAE
ncbi:MAG: filamentous hemagglutinin family protein, partial [Pseudomonadota bacterium]